MASSKNIFIFVVCIFFTSSLLSRDIVTDLMKDSVATFSDAADLIYYSFKSIGQPAKKKSKKQIEAKISDNTSAEEVQEYLNSKGIHVVKDNQPISRQDFAKTLIERFQLKTSIFTDLFGSKRYYFRDAVALGIFTENELGHETLTTRELLKAYTRADSLSKGR